MDNASKKQYLRPKAEKGLEMCANARELMANPVDAKIVNIGAPINSPYAEYWPIVAYDENTIYFTSRRYRADGSNDSKVEARTGMYYEDMYVSFRSISGNWMEPELLNINAADAHSSVVSMSPDGRRIYIYKTFSGNGNIYESEFILGIGWTTPELVGSNVNTKDNEFFATITADDQRLYFVSDRSGGLGGKDIWYSNKLPNGEWEKAIKLGSPINTEGDEYAPYLHPDGKTMYFSSNGHKSMGGYDIFYSQYAESEWSFPTNLGYPINTTDDDHSYISTPDGNRAYYSSKGANSIGSTDIYVVEYDTNEDDRPSVDLSVFALIKGWVFPAPDEALPSELKILIRDIKTNEIQGQAKPVERNGSFVFIVPAGTSYDVTLSLEDEILYTERIDIPEGKVYQELRREIFLQNRNNKVNAIAINDKTLGNVMKWQLTLREGPSLIPLGSMVYYLNQKGETIYSSYVSKDGFFEFKKLSPDESYILKPVLSSGETADVEIGAINDPSSQAPALIKVGSVFYEEGKVPSKNTVDDDLTLAEKVDVDEIGEKTLSKKDKMVNQQTSSNLSSEDRQTSWTINFDYNVTSQIPMDQIDKIVQAIKSGLENNERISISLEGSASTVPTNIKGGNQGLAEARLKNGKAALMKRLSDKGVDIDN